jgi:RNA polymerase sigma factor for flagellar operon FliA
VTPAELFLANLALIQRIIAYTAVRHRLSVADRDEFASYAQLRLIEDDYRPLRQFTGRSKLGTYLTTVIERLFLDFRIQQWGKWRPSSQAKRLGALAIQLEKLLTRDRLTRDEAFEQLQSTLPEPPSRAELEELHTRLPVRMPRQMVSEEVLEHVASAPPADAIEVAERAASLGRAIDRLRASLEQLAETDRQIIRLRFEQGLTVPRIAAMLHLEPKPLYRRIDNLKADLRRRLEGAGVSAADVHELLGDKDDPGPMRGRRGSGSSRPSH